MESINPIENPTLSLKKNYNKSIQVRLDKELFEELTERVNENKYVFNSVSHFARCAIKEKLRGKE